MHETLKKWAEAQVRDQLSSEVLRLESDLAECIAMQDYDKIDHLFVVVAADGRWVASLLDRTLIAVAAPADPEEDSDG